MRLFLDECIDRKLARQLAPHEVRTARQMRWTSVRNGKLLSLVAQQFDAFVTVDRNLAFQQNLDMLPVAVVVLRARSNQLAHLEPLVPKLLAALEKLKPKLVTFIAA